MDELTGRVKRRDVTVSELRAELLNLQNEVSTREREIAENRLAAWTLNRSRRPK
jgi:hypothetical protein